MVWIDGQQIGKSTHRIEALDPSLTTVIICFFVTVEADNELEDSFQGYWTNQLADKL